jgi:hypothetical protein
VSEAERIMNMNGVRVGKEEEASTIQSQMKHDHGQYLRLQWALPLAGLCRKDCECTHR